MNEEKRAPAPEPEHVVVLVHGTFARGAEWTHPDSKLATKVSSALAGDSLVTPFEWSGRNSHNARLSAGIELAQQLRHLRSSYSGASLDVVAHSHGGNVVAYAIREPDVRASLGGIVCLGTPFIVPRPRSLKPTLRLLRFGSVALAIWAWLLLVFLTSLVVTLAVYIPQSSMVLSGILYLSIVGVACLLVARLGVRLARYVENRVAPRLKAMQDEIIASLHATFDDVPVLNIQTRRDEAAGVLRFEEWIANVPFRAWSPTAMASVIAMVTVAFVPAYSYVMLQSEDWRRAPLETSSGLILGLVSYLAAVIVVLWVFTTIAQVLCILWAKVFRGHAVGFGEEGFVKNWLAAISASEQPPGAERVRNVIFHLRGRGLRHSLLHKDEAVLRLVASWLATHADRGKELPDSGMEPTQ